MTEAGRLILQRSRRRCFYSLYINHNYSSHPTTSTSTTTSLGQHNNKENNNNNKNVKVKQVTAENFFASLATLRSLIRNSAFIALDTEMTGVSAAPWRHSFEWDSDAVRFLKLRHSASRFAVIQFGLCPFVVDGCRLVAHPHNFHLFPSNYGHHDRTDGDGDGEFLCQTSSLHFLATHRFDFNTCFRHGISYLSRMQEQHLLNSSNATRTSSPDEDDEEEEGVDFATQTTADLLFTQRMKISLHQWIQLISNGGRRITDDFLEFDLTAYKFANFETTFYKKRPALLLHGYTSHHLRLLRLVVRKNFSDHLVFVRTRAANDNNTWESRIVFIHSEEDKASFLKEVQGDLKGTTESILTSAVGFRHVIDLLSSQDKLIVGHNCILDIAHMYDKFIGPIPSTMEEFVNEVHKTFPNIIDTKHIMNANHTVQRLMKNRSKSLSSAFSSLCPAISSGWSDRSASDKFVNVQVQADDNGSSWFNSGAKHEAGYDAFMTGCVFAQLCTHLGINFDQALPKIPSIPDPLQSNVNLKPYLNHLYVTWNSGTVLDLATGTEKPEDGAYKRRHPKVVFENIVLLWGFTSSLNSKILRGSIEKVFGADSVVSVFFIDSSAALVQFKKDESAKDFLVLKESLDRRKGDPISMLHPLSVIIEGCNTKAGNYNTYKDVIASNLCKVLFKDQADASGVKCKPDLENGETGKEEGGETVLQQMKRKAGKVLFLDHDHNTSNSFSQIHGLV